jgi:hypothetical protein
MRERFQLVCSSRAKHDPGVPLGEQDRGGLPNSTARAGNRYDFAFNAIREFLRF